MAKLAFGVAVVALGICASQLVARSGNGTRGPKASHAEAPAFRFAQHSPDSGQTIERFLSEALRSNPGLSAARSRVQSAEARVPQAAAWDDPQAGVEFYATPVTSANPLSEGMETDYFLQQMVPFPGKKALMGEAAALNAKASGQSAAGVERNVVAGVKRSYAMLYSVQRQIDVNEENQQLLNQIIESARAKYSVGISGQADVLKVQVELAKLENERAALDQELSSSIAMMNTLRGVPVKTPIGRVAELVPHPLSETLDSLCADALVSRPEILGMKSEIEMSRAELSAARREWFPDLMLKGTYKQMKEGTDQWAAMVGINIPVAPWGIGKYSGRVEENEANVRANEQSLADMQNMAQSEVRDAYAKVVSRWQQIERYRGSILPQAEQSLDAGLASYKIDKIDFLSLLDSYRMLQMFRMEYYMAVGEYFVNLAALERATGRDLR